MKKIIIGVSVFVALGLFVFFNLGRWVDVTQKPVKSDIIVCLGGGTPERVKVAIKLYKEGYSRANQLLLIGENRTNLEYIHKYEPQMAYFHDKSPKDTKEEVAFVKKYMNKNGYKSALIITDPPHSKRVAVLASSLKLEGDELMEIRVVSSGTSWWNRDEYYSNARAREFANHEIIRIIYSYFFYTSCDN